MKKLMIGGTLFQENNFYSSKYTLFSDCIRFHAVLYSNKKNKKLKKEL